jgi:hypothetical protein
MNAFLQCVLILILLAAVLVLLTLVASWTFGFSFGVRVGSGNNMREVSRMQLTIIPGVAVIVALVSLVLLKRLRDGGKSFAKRSSESA